MMSTALKPEAPHPCGPKEGKNRLSVGNFSRREFLRSTRSQALPGQADGLVESGRAAAFPQESTGGRLAPTTNVRHFRCWGMAFWSDLFYPTCIADNKSVLGCDAGDGVTDLCSSKGDPCP